MNDDKNTGGGAANAARLVIGVGSGKGGVGKSTTAVLLAQACAAKGLKVGLLDADITGPSVPRLLGLDSFRAENDGSHLIPIASEEGVGVMSINFLVEDEVDPVIWRGPLLSRAVEQFWTDTAWGELDVLVVDLPPGTGDVVITALTVLPMTGVLFVATPQDLVSMVVSKAAAMALAAKGQVLGVVENMGSIVCPECGTTHALFASGRAATDGTGRPGLPRLAAFPFRPEIAQRGVLRWSSLPEGLKAEALAFADAALSAASKAATVIAADREATTGEQGGCGSGGACDGCDKASGCDCSAGADCSAEDACGCGTASPGDNGFKS